MHWNVSSHIEQVEQIVSVSVSVRVWVCVCVCVCVFVRHEFSVQIELFTDIWLGSDCHQTVCLCVCTSDELFDWRGIWKSRRKSHWKNGHRSGRSSPTSQLHNAEWAGHGNGKSGQIPTRRVASARCGWGAPPLDSKQFDVQTYVVRWYKRLWKLRSRTICEQQVDDKHKRLFGLQECMLPEVSRGNLYASQACVKLLEANCL